MTTTRLNVCAVVSCLFAISITCTPSSIAAVGLDTASAAYLFEEGSGDVALDSSGNGNDGECRNGPTWVDGRFGKAMEFNGVDACVVVAEPIGLPEGNAPRTLTLWLKWAEIKWPAPGIEPMGYGANVPGQRLGIWITNEHGLGLETCGVGMMFPWEGDTDWHHLAISYPEGETTSDMFKLYFDGVAQEGILLGAAQDQELNTSAGPLAIGVLPDPLVYHFNGAIDEVAIFAEELSPAQIADIAENGLLGGTAVSPAGKLATAWGHVKAR
jgi:hypothetical protein